MMKASRGFESGKVIEQVVWCHCCYEKCGNKSCYVVLGKSTFNFGNSKVGNYSRDLEHYGHLYQLSK